MKILDLYKAKIKFPESTLHVFREEKMTYSITDQPNIKIY
jgi:hypothetical protein